MPNEYVFEPVEIDRTFQFLDSQMVAGTLRSASIPVFLAEYRQLILEVSNHKEEECPPGCHSMLRDIDGKTYFERLGDSDFEFESFEAYRDSLETQRIAQDIAITKSRTLLAWEGSEPVGGIVIYNPVITAQRPDGVIEFAAHVGPFTVDRSLSAVMMNHLLENKVTATPTFWSENTLPLTMQLVEWRFPEYENNRWHTNFASNQVWIDNFTEHDIEFESKDDQTYWKTLRKRVALSVVTTRGRP